MVSVNSSRAETPAKIRLRNYLLIFSVSLFLPLIFLSQQGYMQLRYEMYFPYRWSAEQTVMAIDEVITSRMEAENNRPVSDYRFYTVSENPLSKMKSVMLSPLSETVKHDTLPGLKGYFQIDNSGKVSSPLLPFDDVARLAGGNLDLEWSEIDRRLKLQAEIKNLLAGTGFTHSSMVMNPMLLATKWRAEKTWISKEGDVERFIESSSTYVSPSKAGFEFVPLKVGPFHSYRSPDGQFIFYRSVQGESHFLQGFVLSQDELFEMWVGKLFATANFNSTVRLQLVYGEEFMRQYEYRISEDGVTSVTVLPRDNRQGKMVSSLYDKSVAQPMGELKLSFYAEDLPVGPASMLMGALLLAVVTIITVGLIVIYRLGMQQIQLADDRLNFVSAVSHELKTPLTSIIMYSEMLREKMVASESKRYSYYDFIFYESERLSRLISNVLQLSRISRNETDLNLEYVAVDTLINIVQSKVSTLVEKNGFLLQCSTSSETGAKEVLVDLDAFSQIVINLIDNAIKFSNDEASEQEKRIEINFVMQGEMIIFSVRDYGPGVPLDQSKKIFELFYRSGSELTRTQPGTGIGLSLVSELAKSMGGSVELINQDPGAEFQVFFQSRDFV